MKEGINECVYRGLDEKLKEIERVEKLLSLFAPSGEVEWYDTKNYLSKLQIEVKQIWQESGET